MTAGGSDGAFLSQALALAALGEGNTSPNPRVGCVVVHEGAVVGTGHHRLAGTPHAEALAVEMAGARARGATLYVNLEPCAHEGRTPPCADRIVRAGVRRVVASIVDPDPRVNGAGIERMRSAGIDVVVGGASEAAARALNAPFLHWHRTGRPLVSLKAAATLDGQLGARGVQTSITGPAARRFAHRLRYAHDAILVGAGTVRTDDPRLTVRLPGVTAPRLRAVLAPALDLPPGGRIFDPAGGPPVRVYVARDLPERIAQPFAGRAEIVRVGGSSGGLDLDEVLRDLGERGARSVLVEGGGATIGSFLAAGLAQRAYLFVSPRLFGARGAIPVADVEAPADPAAGWGLAGARRLPLGEDAVVFGAIG
jgi:diaminohydroxyphosphoribosylaminopyrimidine deaminase/5-amino-6-(5-phosphoribosylamino)uracil reductase